MKRVLSICISFMIPMFMLFPIGVFKANVDELLIQSEAVIVIDQKSGDVLYEKGAERSMYPASITKIATAIFAIENGDLQDLVTVSKRARNADGTRVYLEEGEVVTLEKLIKGMMINSGNDAAIAIAEHVSGSVEQFADELNEYLKTQIGVHNTHFVNPSGLFHEDHQTTASDMAKITQYAMKNEVFRDIFGTKQLLWDGQSWDTTIINHHKLLIDSSFPEVTGGKTGYVDESGNTLVTTAENELISVIIVTLKAKSSKIAYNDTVSLIHYSFNHFETSEIKSGITYENEEKKKFELTEGVYFTKKKEEEITEKVNEQGELLIYGEGERLIKKVLLHPLVEELAEKKEQQPVQTSGLAGQFHVVMIISLFAAFLVTSFFFREVRKI